jgi:gluconolactonase
VLLAAFLATHVIAAEPPGLPPTVVPGATLTEVYGDGRFYEGPTWDPRGRHLYFTAFGKEREDTQVLRLESPGKVTLWLDKTEGVNGTCLTHDGKLLAAQAFGHRVIVYAFGRKGPHKTRVLLHDTSLNQPNDIVEAPNGNIYFTDPDFGSHARSAVYLLRKNGEKIRLISDMPLPNGLKLSPDALTLYVGDSHEKLWRAFPILPNGITGPGRVFFNPDTPNRTDPDGMTVDERGNLYLSGRGGVWVANPRGEALGFITVPEFCSNLTFGDADGRSLYLTCNGKVYRLAMNVRGALFAQR